jgi:hypothetical protein
MKDVVEKMAQFTPRCSGGLRLEANAVCLKKTADGVLGGGADTITTANITTRVGDCLNSAFQAALLFGDSTISGLHANAVISVETRNSLNAAAVGLASARAGCGDYALLIQGITNQMGQYVTSQSPSRTLTLSGKPLKRWLRVLSRSRALLGGDGGDDDGGGGEERGGSCSGACGGDDNERGRYTLLSELPANEERAALVLLGKVDPLEKLSTRDAKAAFISTGTIHETRSKNSFTAQVTIPAAGGRAASRSSQSLAVGTYAQVAFSIELYHAGLAFIHQGALKRPENRMAILGAGLRCPYRISAVKGTTTQCSPNIHEGADAVMRSPLAQKLVFKHLVKLNAAVSAQLAVIPRHKGLVNDQTKADFARHAGDGAREFFKLREALVSFIRTRHAVQSVGTGQSLSREFQSLVRGPAVSAAVPGRRQSIEGSFRGLSLAAAADEGGEEDERVRAEEEARDPAPQQRHRLFHREVLRNTKAPFLMQLHYLLGKINESLVSQGQLQFEENEGASMVMLMAENGFPIRLVGTKVERGESSD